MGACESLASPYRSWFTFHDVAVGTGTCVGSAGPNSATYDGWFGFELIPVINKSLPAVQHYFLTLLPPPPPRQRLKILAGQGRQRLAYGCHGRRLLPEWLLGNLP